MSTKKNKNITPDPSGSRQSIDHNCTGDPNCFCYVCAEYIWKKSRKNITEKIKSLFEICFDIEILQQDTNWVLHVICAACYNMLKRFEKHQNKNNLVTIRPKP